MDVYYCYYVFLLVFSIEKNVVGQIVLNKGTIFDEDDDLLAAIIPTVSSLGKRQFIADQQQNIASFKPAQQISSLVETISEPPTRRSMKSDAANIVGDVNKYGLWEYTADNTGMGDQIKTLMDKANSVDVAAGESSHALENEAKKMNARINKYAEEETTEPGAAIDPLESPADSKHSVAQKALDKQVPAEQKFFDHGESVSVVTIPSTMTIEDEHGQHLDTVNDDPSKVTEKVDPIKAFIKQAGVLLHHRKFHPTHPKLTAKLLKAMQQSSLFRKQAEELLPGKNDTEIDLFQKERKLGKYLKEYENNEKFAKTGEIKLTIPKHFTVENKEGGGGEFKMLSSIKQLIHDDYSSHDEEGKVLNDLLNTMRKSEKDEGKIEANFQDDSARGGGEGESLSEPYLNHFKEFLQKHKQANIHDEEAPISDDGEHPLGSESSPMLGYLEQEASSFNKFHEAGANPKVDLQRMQALLQQVEDKHESVDKQNEKLLKEQLKLLMHDKSEHEKYHKQIKEHNGDGKDIVSLKDGAENQVFDEAILNYVRHSNRFKSLLNNHHHDTGSTKSTDDNSSDDDDSQQGSGDGSGKEMPLSEQLKEIELQRDILNLKEKNLKNRDKHDKKKQLKVEEKKFNHLLHLVSPSKESKQLLKSESEKELEELDVLTDNEKGKKNKDKEELKSKFTKDNKEVKNKEDDSSDKKRKSAKSSSNSKSEGRSQERESKDKLEETSDESKNTKLKDDDIKHNVGSTTIKDDPQLGLPINNPKPDAETTLQPHANFHYTHSEHLIHYSVPTQASGGSSRSILSPIRLKPRIAPSSSLLNINIDIENEDSKSAHLATKSKAPQTAHIAPQTAHITPINSHIAPPSLMNMTSGFENPSSSHMAPSLMNLTSNSNDNVPNDNNIPPAGPGGPKTNNALKEHHIYPIIEPPPIDDSDNQALIHPNEIVQPFVFPPVNTFSHLLKHKSIPESPNGEHYLKDSALNFFENLDSMPDPIARFIKPKSKSPTMMDVTASKKSFRGELPLKPKEFLLQELKKDINLLTSKRNLNTKKVRYTQQQTINNSRSNILDKAAKIRSKSRNSTKLSKIYLNKNNNVLVPVNTKNSTTTTTTSDNFPAADKKTNINNKKVLVPAASKIILVKVRSTITDTKENKKSYPDIEDVFNMLQTEDQINST